jgi:hypothetical protein
VQYRQTLNANPLQENTTPGAQVLTDIEFLDNLGNPLQEICEDTPVVVGKVAKIATVNDYNLIVAFKRNDATQPSEREDYALGILPQLQEEPFTLVDVTFSGTDAEFEIEPGFLEDGVEYRVIAIAKEENLTPPPSCPILTMNTRTIVTSTTPTQASVTAQFTLTGLGALAVTTLDITTSTNPNTTPTQVDNFFTATGSYTYNVNFPSGGGGNPIDMVMLIYITLSNGCTYSGYVVVHPILLVTNAQTDITENVNPD